MAQVEKCEGFKVGDLVRILGVPDAVGLVLAIEIAQHFTAEYQVCWLKVLWTDLGPPANWERAEWMHHYDNNIE